MDFGKLNLTKNADRGAVLNVLHPITGEPIEGVTVTLLGKDSTLYNRKLAELRQSLKISKTDVSVEIVNESLLDIKVAAVVAWTGIELADDAGKLAPLPCTPENVRLILADTGYKWLSDQIEVFIDNRANFFFVNEKSS